MECNKDEAMRAKDIAVRKLTERDAAGAKKFALKAQNLYPELEGLPQLLATLDVFISAEKKINGEIDWYGVLSVDPFADDDTVRKHYRKLALTLHPDKNKLIGADGAFKILSEAWSLLSDKAKRSAYDQKRNIRRVNQKRPMGNVTVPAGRNGFHNFTNGVNFNATNQRVASFPTVPRPPKPNTFWTVCKRCKMQYEYLIDYLNQALLCPNCHEPFLAVPTEPPPLNGRQTSTPWPEQQQKHSSGSHTINTNSDGPRLNHANSHSDSILKSGGNGSSPASNPSLAPAPHLTHTNFDRFKRWREEVQMTGSVNGGERRMKRRGDETTMRAAGREMKNQMCTKNEDGMGSAYVSQRSSSETTRVNIGGSARSSITRDLSNLETRNLLMGKARTEIRKKLNEWSAVAPQKTSCKDEKRKGKEKQEASVTAVKDGASEQLAATAMTVPDPDFHDFDKDRTEKSFGENEVWAAYDGDDGMPRYYAMIHGVVSKRPFKMRISWLNSKSNSELAPINWIGSGFPKTSGDFRIGKHEFNNSINSFSQKVKWAKGPRGVINIYPSKGEVWALYRNWSSDWNELTPDEAIHKYDMVEVLEDYSEEQGVTVTPLVKVAGFRTVFRQHLDPMQVRTIPREELFRFSHQVPSYLLTGQEAQNAPKGCRELDPAAVPLELLQVVSEDEGKRMVENDVKLNAGAVTNVKEKVIEGN